MNTFKVVPYDATMQEWAMRFECGNIYLDNFLHYNRALDKNECVTYIMLDEVNHIGMGYYSLSAGDAEYNADRMRKLGGAVYIKAFAVDKRLHGIVAGTASNGNKWKLSDLLMDECLNRISYIRENYLGFEFVTLSATRAGYNLYRRHGFEDIREDMSFSIEESEDGCKPMYLALDIA